MTCDTTGGLTLPTGHYRQLYDPPAARWSTTPLDQLLDRPRRDLGRQPSSTHRVVRGSTAASIVSPSGVLEGDLDHHTYRHGSQLTRPRSRAVTQRLGDGTPRFVRISVRLRDTESNLVRGERLVQPQGGFLRCHHPTAVTSNDASMTSRHPQQPSNTPMGWARQLRGAAAPEAEPSRRSPGPWSVSRPNEVRSPRSGGSEEKNERTPRRRRQSTWMSRPTSIG
jgi:hypothetical protein